MNEAPHSKSQESLPPVAVVMQMVMGAWVSQTISAVTRLDIPDLLHKHGAKTAFQLTNEYGVQVKPEFLERALRASASIGIFTEEKDGRFGPTELSGVLTSSSPVSIKKLTEVFGGTWWKIWGGLPDALRTGEPQAKAQLGMEYWEYCKANPKEMEDFGEAMKSNSLNSMRGVLDNCDLTGIKTVADIGGGFGHMVVALLKKYRDLRGIVLEVSDLIPLAQQRLIGEAADVASRIDFIGGDMFEEVPPAEAYIMKHIIHDWDDARCVRSIRSNPFRTTSGRLLSRARSAPEPIIKHGVEAAGGTLREHSGHYAADFDGESGGRPGTQFLLEGKSLNDGDIARSTPVCRRHSS